MTARPAQRRFPFLRVLSGLAAVLATALVLWVGLPLLAPAWLILTFVGLDTFASWLSGVLEP